MGVVRHEYRELSFAQGIECLRLVGEELDVLFRIEIALRLILRTRLTLIRLALIRKPWSCGVRVSRPHYRYLCLHLLFHTLHEYSRTRFDAEWNAPLPHLRVQNFGDMLDARLLSTLCRSTSELLRTL